MRERERERPATRASRAARGSAPGIEARLARARGALEDIREEVREKGNEGVGGAGGEGGLDEEHRDPCGDSQAAVRRGVGMPFSPVLGEASVLLERRPGGEGGGGGGGVPPGAAPGPSAPTITPKGFFPPSRAPAGTVSGTRTGRRGSHTRPVTRHTQRDNVTAGSCSTALQQQQQLLHHK